MRWLRGALHRSEHGQALVEAAIALPLILLLSLAAFDVGRGIITHVQLTEATQEGSLFAAHRFGSFASEAAADSAVSTRITTSSNAEAVANAVVTSTCTSSPAPGTVVVTSTYAMPIVSPPAHILFGPTLAIGARVTATHFHEDGCP